MSAATAILWTAAAFMFGFGPAFCLALAICERRDARAEDRRRAEQDRAVDAAWLAVLAATDGEDLIYQQMCFERWEADL